MKSYIFTFFFVLIQIKTALSQNSFTYELSLVPVNIPNLPGLHSYSHAQSNGKWLIIGGRKDGIHPRQPNQSFPASQNNTDIYVIDIKNKIYKTSSVNSLPSNLKEQLQSTNMCFYQEEDTLYIVGGYGYSQTANNHITYPYLTTVSVSGLINAIENNQPINSFFKQIQDSAFAVTGGYLKKLNNTFYLVGGHRFDGRYNPMGGPSYTQKYTEQIRKFTIDNSGNQLSFGNYSTITDPVHLRRRDYNLLPQIFPNGEHGFTISSGVFQLGVDLPFLYPVDIKESGYYPITNFNQYLSNYHSANVSLYDSIGNYMHTLFFGGMSQFYYQNGTLIEDSLVPFVKTISRLTRDANGNLTEYQMPIEMPGLKGSSAEFIYNLELPHYPSKIIKLSEITQNHFMIGHIYGGINSSSLNPFANNQISQTNADSIIYEVWLTKSPTSKDYQISGKNPYDISVNPNPTKDFLEVNFHLKKPTIVKYIITNTTGKIILNETPKIYSNGNKQIKIDLSEQDNGIYFIIVVFDNRYYVTKKINKID